MKGTNPRRYHLSLSTQIFCSRLTDGRRVKVEPVKCGDRWGILISGCARCAEIKEMRWSIMFVLNQRHFDAYKSVARWRFNCNAGGVKIGLGQNWALKYREKSISCIPNWMHVCLKTQHNVSNSHRFNVTTASIYTAQQWYLLRLSHVSTAENLYLPQKHRQENNTEFQSDVFRISYHGDLTRWKERTPSGFTLNHNCNN